MERGPFLVGNVKLLALASQKVITVQALSNLHFLENSEKHSAYDDVFKTLGQLREKRTIHRQLC